VPGAVAEKKGGFVLVKKIRNRLVSMGTLIPLVILCACASTIDRSYLDSQHAVIMKGCDTTVDPHEARLRSLAAIVIALIERGWVIDIATCRSCSCSADSSPCCNSKPVELKYPPWVDRPSPIGRAGLVVSPRHCRGASSTAGERVTA
jgi:hypothetical protein